MAEHKRSVVIVDLNNFARYPTIAVGYLASILRSAGYEVRVLSPLAHGVPGVPREPRAGRLSLLNQQLSFASAFAGSSSLRAVRARAASARLAWRGRTRHRVVEQLEHQLARGADAVLVSAYLMYHDLCCDLGRVCQSAGVPMLIGGSYFFQPEVAEEWRNVPGLSALSCGEIERELPGLVAALIGREDLSCFPGIRQPDGRDGPVCPPLRDLDTVPFPDYSDFPWRAYPNAIIPIVTGRGCAWGRCTFCSDITSTAGRSFRSRSPENVLAEMEYQAARHKTRLFVFTDLKLNSNLAMWHSLLDNVQKRVPGARWIAAVHVGARQPHGLSAGELRAARAAGMVRITTGLESGSQRVLDLMNKGAELGVTSRFVEDATDAGISVRTTMIVGYPGEEPDDVRASATFLRRHRRNIDRVNLNRFALITGTSVHRRMGARPECAPGLMNLTVNHQMARIEHRYEPASRLPYRLAVSKLVSAVHRINRSPLGEEARDFEGVM
jgi:anaerobic magnesium-protoporphyrin IX monomethyl ester cyclase